MYSKYKYATLYVQPHPWLRIPALPPCQTDLLVTTVSFLNQSSRHHSPSHSLTDQSSKTTTVVTIIVIFLSLVVTLRDECQWKFTRRAVTLVSLVLPPLGIALNNLFVRRWPGTEFTASSYCSIGCYTNQCFKRISLLVVRECCWLIRYGATRNSTLDLRAVQCNSGSMERLKSPWHAQKVLLPRWYSDSLHDADK